MQLRERDCEQRDVQSNWHISASLSSLPSQFDLERREKDLVLENRKLTAAKEDAKRELLELKVAMLRQGRCNCGYVRDYIHKCAQNVA